MSICCSGRFIQASLSCPMLALFILIILACVGVCQWASGRYEQVLGQGMKERAPTAHTGAEIARLFLAFEGVADVEIVEHSGVATDYFDPRRRRLFLQPRVSQGTSIGAWAIALHEAGHAAQTGEALSELQWRQNVIRLNRYGPIFGLLGMAGMIFMRLPPRFAGMMLIVVCVLLLMLNLGTLAIEHNANARVRRFLEKHLGRQPDEMDRLLALMNCVAVREVGDLLKSPRYFMLSAMPGSGKIRPVK